ncbi:MAG: Hpt domain-containing protein [Phycisphaeraceae bacterium]|nr:Hpt domain-containing protein [Phycisphaeraceae bacterium]MCW5763260.1 Hpt domain-containing protein [Phycisphaeraceae bacterium]
MGQDAFRRDPITSTFADDPEMKELIGLFIQELPQRVAALEQAWNSADLGSLRRLAHQLKGSAAGFGFESIGIAAGELESPLRDRPVQSDALDGVEHQFRELVALCSHAVAGVRHT